MELNIQLDHVHLVAIIPPKVSTLTLMGVLKGRTAIWIFNKFPHIREKLCGNYFWARFKLLNRPFQPYYAPSTGLSACTFEFVRH